MSKHKHETNEERRSQYQICGDPPNTNWKLTNQLFIVKNTLWHAVLHGESNCCRISPQKWKPAVQEGPPIFQPDVKQSPPDFFERNLNFDQK